MASEQGRLLTSANRSAKDGPVPALFRGIQPEGPESRKTQFLGEPGNCCRWNLSLFGQFDDGVDCHLFGMVQTKFRQLRAWSDPPR